MKAIITLLLSVLALTACRADEYPRVYGASDRVWQLRTLGGTPFPALATLTFPEKNQIVGRGPCNRYFGALKGPYPAFNAGPIGSTRMGCPEGAAETAFLAALEAATIAKATKDTLILSSPSGSEMVFRLND